MKNTSPAEEPDNCAIWSGILGNTIATMVSAFFLIQMSNCSDDCPTKKKPPNNCEQQLQEALHNLQRLVQEVHKIKCRSSPAARVVKSYRDTAMQYSKSHLRHEIYTNIERVRQCQSPCYNRSRVQELNAISSNSTAVTKDSKESTINFSDNEIQCEKKCNLKACPIRDERVLTTVELYSSFNNEKNNSGNQSRTPKAYTTLRSDSDSETRPFCGICRKNQTSKLPVAENKRKQYRTVLVDNKSEKLSNKDYADILSTKTSTYSNASKPVTRFNDNNFEDTSCNGKRCTNTQCIPSYTDSNAESRDYSFYSIKAPSVKAKQTCKKSGTKSVSTCYSFEKPTDLCASGNKLKSIEEEKDTLPNQGYDANLERYKKPHRKQDNIKNEEKEDCKRCCVMTNDERIGSIHSVGIDARACRLCCKSSHQEIWSTEQVYNCNDREHVDDGSYKSNLGQKSVPAPRIDEETARKLTELSRFEEYAEREQASTIFKDNRSNSDSETPKRSNNESDGISATEKYICSEDCPKKCTINDEECDSPDTCPESHLYDYSETVSGTVPINENVQMNTKGFKSPDGVNGSMYSSPLTYPRVHLAPREYDNKTNIYTTAAGVDIAKQSNGKYCSTYNANEDMGETKCYYPNAYTGINVASPEYYDDQSSYSTVPLTENIKRRTLVETTQQEYQYPDHRRIVKTEVRRQLPTVMSSNYSPGYSYSPTGYAVDPMADENITNYSDLYPKVPVQSVRICKSPPTNDHESGNTSIRSHFESDLYPQVPTQSARICKNRSTNDHESCNSSVRSHFESDLYPQGPTQSAKICKSRPTNDHESCNSSVRSHFESDLYPQVATHSVRICKSRQTNDHESGNTSVRSHFESDLYPQVATQSVRICKSRQTNDHESCNTCVRSHFESTQTPTRLANKQCDKTKNCQLPVVSLMPKDAIPVRSSLNTLAAQRPPRNAK